MLEIISIKQTKIKLGAWCKSKRQVHNLSQEGLARLLDLSRLTIRKLENGNNVTLDTVLKVVNHFDMLDLVYQAIDNDISESQIESLY